VRWLADRDLRAALRAALWVLLANFAHTAYLLAVLAAPPGYIAVTPIFLPMAFILAALLLTPRRHWWLPLAVWCTYLLVQNILRSNPPVSILAARVAGLTEAIVAAVLVLRFVSRPTEFSSLVSVSRYVGCVILAAVLGATFVWTVRTFAGTAREDLWLTWFMSEVLAVLFVTPTIILWVRAGRGGLRAASRARFVEAAALGSAFLLLVALRFATNPADEVERAIQLYAPIALLLWAAVRFGPRGLLSYLSVFVLLGITAASSNPGASTSTNIFATQLFLFTIGVPLFGLAALVQERQDAQEALRRSEERYHAIVGNIPRGAVLLFGPDLRHRFAEGQGLPDLGLAGADILGKTPLQVFPAPMADILDPHYRAALLGARASFDLTHSARCYHAEVRPVASAERPTGMLLLQDVTEVRRAQALAAANAELERVSKAKSEFVSTVSHELRTPLTSIQAFSELLRYETFSAIEVREFAGDINREAERLTRLIGDLLDLDRMQSGQMTLQREALDLNELVRKTATQPRDSLHSVRLELDPALPTFLGDRDKLTQVVLNLVSNAIRYSPDGGVVTVGTRGEPGQVHLWVQDEGIGIAAADLETIFERFRRAASEDTMSIQGTGLGLPIVRQIAELHGGRAWAESELGVGSTFHVTLPL
jgi:signal transduction histidine kinase/integral membrane sensor domain MASE1